MNELYDLQQDPFEMQNLIDSKPASNVRHRMETELDGLLAPRKAGPPVSPGSRP